MFLLQSLKEDLRDPCSMILKKNVVELGQRIRMRKEAVEQLRCIYWDWLCDKKHEKKHTFSVPARCCEYGHDLPDNHEGISI